MNDKELTGLLMERGLSFEHARIAVGMIVEERQTADRSGYKRGYNHGYNRGYSIGKNDGMKHVMDLHGRRQ